MDSLTHVFFAHALLNTAGADTSAAICGLFPQIDRRPAYLHRLYAHPFSQMKRLAAIGAQVVETGVIKEGCERDYEWRRFEEELPRMRGVIAAFERESGISSPEFHPDRISVLLAFVSHTYNDIFNNPVQAFSPGWTFPSGAWKLWSEIDGVNFRVTLYHPENIAALRSEFFRHEEWRVRFEAVSLLNAIIRRTAAASIVPVPDAVIESTLKSFGIEDHKDETQVEEAERFLAAKEEQLSELIRKYSSVVSIGKSM